jgi:hypothetical protein
MPEEMVEHETRDGDEPKPTFPEISLEDFPQDMKTACKRAGWTELMPVQSKAIPFLLEGKDLMVQSRTGSGKTGAFVLPILHRIDPAEATCQALILVPTRELAKQVCDEASKRRPASSPSRSATRPRSWPATAGSAPFRSTVGLATGPSWMRCARAPTWWWGPRGASSTTSCAGRSSSTTCASSSSTKRITCSRWGSTRT